MRIIHVMAGAKHGGAETACIDYCLAMREAGYDVAFIGRPNPRNARLREAGIEVHELPFGGALDLYTPMAMKNLFRRLQPDIVQCWMQRAAGKTPRWSPIMRIPRYLVVSRLGGYYKLKNYRSTDYFTTITPMIRDYLIGKNVGTDHVRHINNFAETAPPTAKMSRATHDTPAKAPLLVTLSRLHESKGLDTLLNALKDLPEAHLWLAGEGPDRAKLEALVADLGLKDRVRFLGWCDDRAALLEAADICVFPSRYEPFGTVFVQAWAAETPVVVSDADGPRQFVRDGEDALMVPRDDAASLARALSRVIDDNDLRARLVKNGRKRYEAEFTKAQTMRAYLDWYREIRAREALPEEGQAG